MPEDIAILPKAMKWLALFSLTIVAGYLHAYRTNDGFEVETMNQNDLEAMEEKLYDEMLRMEQKLSSMGAQDEMALEQTNALCNDTNQCNCKLNHTTVTITEPGVIFCFVLNVSYCEGPCRSTYRYI